MFRNKVKLTGIVGVISALVFASAFALYSSRRTDDGGAVSILGCEASGQARIFLSDIPAYSTYNSRTLLDTNWNNNERTFTLDDQAISPGKYEIRTISSDHHFNHRSDAPDQDVQNQPQEEYYVTIDGARTPNHSTDFTDYYDWRGADGELMQDDDDNIDTVPTVIRNTWAGDFLGTIDVGQSTNTVTVHHSGVFDDHEFIAPNSVVPSALVLTCLEEKSPLLEVEKHVDGNTDGVFNDDQEQAKDGETIRWEVVGRNVGDGADPAATVTSCAPGGTSYTVGSSRVSDGATGGTLTDNINNDGCFSWTGPLEPGESVSIQFDVVANDINECDRADGDEDGLCTCVASIYSDATGTSATQPADTDIAAVNQLLPSLSIIKRVDGSDDNDTFSDISEQIIPDGRNVVWEITASNDGPGDLEDARVVDTYPNGVSVSGVEASVGQASVDGDTVIWNGSLASGESVTLTVGSAVNDVPAFNACEVALAPGNTSGDGVCTNRAFVGEAANDSVNGFDGETKYDDAEVYAVLTPSLTIKKYVDGADADAIYSDQNSELVEATQPFTWRVEGCNVGDAIEPNARVVDIVPAGVNLLDVASAVRVDGVAGSSAVSVTTDPVTDRPAIVWNGSLALGSCVSIEYNTTITDEVGYEACLVVSVGSAGECGVDAYIGAATNDSEVSVDLLTKSSDPAFVEMLFSSVLAIEKSVDGNGDASFDPVVEQTGLNETFSWKIKASNTGNSNEPNARVVDILPANMELVSTSSSQVNVSFVSGSGSTTALNVVQNSGVNAIVWDGSLAPGSSVEIVFLAQLTSEAMLDACIVETEGEHCRNTAEVGHQDVLSPTGVVGQSDSDTADVFAVPAGRLTIIKEVDADEDDSWSDLETVELDGWFNWRISVSNQGDGTVTDVAVLDVFPEGVIVDEIVTVTGPGTPELVAGTDKYRAFWTVPSFAPGETAEFVARAKIADYSSFVACDEGQVDGNSDGLCTNSAFVGTGASPDEFTDVASDDAQVDILKVPELYISKLAEGSDDDSDFTDFEQVGVDGEEFQFRITFGNTGTGVAEDVTMVDPMPTGLTYVQHTLDGSGLADYDEAAGRVTWNGSINPSEDVTITVVARFDEAADFLACDNADGSEDATCENIARLMYDDIEVEDPAFLFNTSLKPVLEISKVVDANDDGTFTEVESTEANASVVTWQVEITNTGDAPARDVVMSDDVEEGLEYMADSVVEVEGAELGVAQYNDGIIEWTGGVPVDGRVVVQFKTRVASAAKFGACNLSDGNAEDEQCTNNAVLSIGTGDTPIDEDTANITTESLTTILAYTGSSQGISSVVVGGAIAFVATLLLVGAYASRGRGGGDDDSSNPMASHPPQIVMPQ